METEKPSVLLVGAGRWGENHLRVWHKLHVKGECNFVGVYDCNCARLKEIGKEFSVQIFQSLEEGLSKATAVDVTVPTYNHFMVAKAALLAGKDVLVEKPLTATVQEAEELERICKNSSQVFMVGHLFRYNPAVDYVKKLLTEGEIGKIRFLRGRFMGFRFKEHDAGILATTAIHFIYLANYLMGREPESVSAKVSYLLDDKLDDACMIRLEYGGGQFCQIESDYFTPGKWRSFDIIGTQGAIQFDALEQKVEMHQKKHVASEGRYGIHNGTTTHPSITFQEPLLLELGHFLDRVRDRRNPDTGIADGISVLRIIDAAYQSSKSDRTIILQPKLEDSIHAVPSLHK